MCSTETQQVMIRKQGLPLHAEGRGSSVEAFLCGRACGSSSFQEPWLPSCKSNQLRVIPTISPLECFQQHVFLGPFRPVIRKKHLRAHDVRGSSAEGPRKPNMQHWIHTNTFASKILSSILRESPNELL